MSQQNKPATPAPQQNRGPTKLTAIVKAVISGDTIVIVHPTRPIEKTVIIAHVQAPRLAKKVDEQEEPFAFAAREYLRKKVIGQQVEFVIEYTNQKTGRDFGSVFVGAQRENVGISLLREGLVKLKQISAKPETEEYRAMEKAQQEAQEAKKGLWAPEAVQQQNVRKVTFDADVEQVFKKYGKKQVNVVVENVLNGSTLRVLFPTYESVVVRLTGIITPGFKTPAGGDKKKQQKPAATTATTTTTVAAPADPLLAAAQAQAEASAKQQPQQQQAKVEKIAEPFANEALQFTESRLLHRDVNFVVEFVEKNENRDSLNGTIVRANAKINDKAPITFQEELLSRGYAKVINNAVKSNYVTRFKAAEIDAKKARKGVWQNYQEPKSTLQDEDRGEFAVRVVEIINGDTLRVVNNKSKEERISLSSIRAPRKGEPFFHDARELVRQRIAGKTVYVRVDYRREFDNTEAPKPQEKAGKKNDKKKGKKGQEADTAASDAIPTEQATTTTTNTPVAEPPKVVVPGAAPAKQPKQPKAPKTDATKEVRRYCTVLVDKKVNLAEALVKEGFATVIKHRADDERSSCYDQLVLAESEAIRSKKALHSNKKGSTLQINDLTAKKDVSEVNKYSKNLKAKRCKAYVEKVFAGTRYKLYLPKDGFVLTFALSGIQSPSAKPAREGALQAPPQFARDSQIFAMDNLLFREVEIDVEEVDKVGVFVGHLFVGNENFGPKILKEGLAFTQSNARKLKTAAELEAAESAAKTASKRIWGNKEFVESVAARNEQRAVSRQGRGQPTTRTANDKPIKIRVTDVRGTTFFFQTSDAADQLAKVEEAIAALNLGDAQAPANVKEGDFVFAPYGEDGYFRAKVKAIKKETKSAVVSFIDYGNTDTVSLDSLRVASADELKKIPAQSKVGQLAFVAFHNDDLVDEAESRFRELALDVDLEAMLEYSNSNGTFYTLTNPSEGSVNSALVRDGLAFASAPFWAQDNEILSKVIAGLKDDQMAAKRDFVGLWENGDIYDDDDE